MFVEGLSRYSLEQEICGPIRVLLQLVEEFRHHLSDRGSLTSYVGLRLNGTLARIEAALVERFPVNEVFHYDRCAYHPLLTAVFLIFNFT